MKRDYYEVLCVDRDADASTLKKAYRALARQHHPDHNQDDPEAEVRFKEATEAYKVLSDEHTRRRYDRVGHAGFGSDGPGGFDPSNMGSSVGEIFEGLFGEVFAARRRQRTMGRDLTYQLTLSFEEAALGTEKMIQIRRAMRCETCAGNGAKPGTEVRKCTTCKGTGEVHYQRRIFATKRRCASCEGRGSRPETPCEPCAGTGQVEGSEQVKVRIPAGVENGAVQSLRGGGDLGAGGRGDLHVTIQIQEHPLFEREGADIHCQVPVSFPEAVLGTDLQVPTLAGKVTMKLPPGTQSGKIFRLRGKGIAAYGGVGKGDQLVTIVVEVPEKISRSQRKLIEELAAEMGTDTHPQRKGFLDKLKDLFD